MKGFSEFMGGIFFIAALVLAIWSVSQPAILGTQIATLAAVAMLGAVYLDRRGGEA